MVAFDLIFLDTLKFDSIYSSNTEIIDIVGLNMLYTSIHQNYLLSK